MGLLRTYITAVRHSSNLLELLVFVRTTDGEMQTAMIALGGLGPTRRHGLFRSFGVV